MNNTFNSQKGAAVFIAVLVTVILLGIALGLSTAFLSQIETLRGVGRSVLALNAADAGIERVLFIDTSTCITEPDLASRISCIKTAVNSLSSGDRQLPNGAIYQLTVEAGGEGSCPGSSNYCASSVGIYSTVRRAIRITR